MATEDDKKKTPNPDIQTTTSASSKQHQNSKQHSTQSSIQKGDTSGQSYSTWTHEAEQSADAAATRAYAAYGYNQKPDGTIERNQSLFDALGLDRDKLRGEREKQMRLNRWKQIESALFNSGAILSDMISAGIGGNVWKRDKETTASNAAKDNERLRELQAAEDAAAAERERKERQDAYKAGEEARYKELDRLKRNVQEGSSYTRGGSQSDTTTESKSDTTSTQTQNQYMSDAYKEYKYAKGSGRSGARSSAYDDVFNVGVKKGDNGQEVRSFAMSKAEKAALGKGLQIAIVNRAQNDPAYRQLMIDSGIIEERISSDGRKILSSKVSDPIAFLDDVQNGITYNGKAIDIPELTNLQIDFITEQGGYNRNGRGITRSEAYEIITGDNIHLPTGKLDPVAVQRLREQGIEFPGERVEEIYPGLRTTSQSNKGFNPDNLQRTEETEGGL